MAGKDIIFENVKKSYDDKTTIIENLNLTIKEGERLVLLGPSGCGKSTTLRMIAGLEEVTEGKLIMDGKVVNDVPSGKRGVSMVFQNYALYPHMTVEKNITYALSVHKVDKNEIKERLSQVLSILGLEEYANRKPKELSGGQRQRVALARALVKRSDYLLLDEPLSNLDAKLRLQARKELVKIHELYGQTFIYVTHDQVEAMTVANRIALMKDGVLQMLDTPYRVYHRPANVFTATFIGSPSMNIMEAEWAGGERLLVGDQCIKLPQMWKDIVEKHGKTKLYLGIRPENLKLCRGKNSDGINVEVEYVEDYGNRYGIYVKAGNQELISMDDNVFAKRGEAVHFVPDYNHIHLFDRESTNSLGYPAALEEGKEESNSFMQQILNESTKPSEENL